MSIDLSAGRLYRPMIRFSAVILAVFLLLPASRPSEAQNAIRIVAVVNDEMISGYDLDQRIRLVTGGNMPNSAEQRSRLATQVLRSMIDERLQLQEAKRLNIRVDRQELNDALARLEKQNGLPPGGLAERLKSEGMSVESLEAQVQASLAWMKVVRRRGARFATVSDDEVDEALARIKENSSKPGLLVAQIFLSVDSPQEEAQVLNNARRLLEELRQGVPFRSLASQFSQDSTARDGGNMGWVQAGQLPQEIDNVLAQMPVGAVSMPIRTAEGYHIVALRDRREPVGGAGQEETRVSVQQIVVPIPARATPAEAASQRALAQTLSETLNGCADLEKAAKEMGVPAVGTGVLRVGDMAADLRQTVLALKVGQASKPLPADDGGVRILMVCEREDAPSNLPSRQNVTAMLTEQKLEMQARRLLRDLRQMAFVDIRA